MRLRQREDWANEEDFSHGGGANNTFKMGLVPIMMGHLIVHPQVCVTRRLPCSISIKQLRGLFVVSFLMLMA